MDSKPSEDPLENWEQHQPNRTFIQVEDAVEDMYQKMLAACSTVSNDDGKIKYNQNVTWVVVFDRMDSFVIEKGAFHFHSSHNRLHRHWSRDVKTMLSETKWLALWRASISTNLVHIIVLDSNEQHIFQGSIRNKNTLPATEEEAYNEIKALFFQLPTSEAMERWPQHHQHLRHLDHDRVMAIMEKHPNLAHRRITFSTETFHPGDTMPAACFCEATPLHCMLASPNPPSLEAIESLHKMNPEAVHQTSGFYTEYTALHVALMMQCPDAIVEFIFKANPSASLQHTEDEELTPIDFLLKEIANGTATHSMLELFMDAFPDIVEYSYGGNILEKAFAMNSSEEVLSSIAKRLPCYVDKFIIDRQEGPFRRDQIQVLRSILPQVQKIGIYKSNAQWSRGSLEMLLASLVQNNNIVELRLHLPITANICRLLKALLERNRILESLDLHAEYMPGHEALETDADKLTATRSILKGLSSNRSLKSIYLWGFHFPSWSEIGIAPESLRQNQSKLQEVLLSTDAVDGGVVPGMIHAFPTITDFDLTLPKGNNPSDAETLAKILVTCPGFRTFWLSTNDGPFDNDLVFDALKRNKSLKSLHVSCEQVDIRGLCNALKCNSCLVSLCLSCSSWPCQAQIQEQFVDILKDCNVTLRKLDVQDSESYKQLLRCSTLRYFLNLNQWGRKIARCNSTSKSVLVGLLGEVVDAPPYQLHLDQQHNMHYGLLRENPSIWAF